jgi:hypothetical protein
LSIFSAVPAHADGFGHDAVIKYRKDVTAPLKLKVCRDWAPDNRGCAGSSPTKKLKQGQSTKKKFGWADADGIWVPKNCWAEASFHNGVQTVRASRMGMDSGAWVKLGGLAGGTWLVTLQCGTGLGGGGGGGW